jgi:hypothetical protein
MGSMTHGVTEGLDMAMDLIIHGTEIDIIVLVVTIDGITPDGITPDGITPDGITPDGII